MRAGLPSTTAAGVSLLRGLASLPGSPFDTANDRSLRALYPRAASLAMDAVGFVTARSPRTHTALRAASLGLLDHVALRTLALDAALRAELARGTSQLVVLGAGLDARAWRMPELRDTVVLEVDHPSTASLKRSRAKGHRALAKDVRFVTIDFEREHLGEALHAGGHDPHRPTVWIWEGVTPYLAHEATAATLEVIGERSAAGSLALVTYCTPEAVNAPGVLLPAVLAGFSVLGEPLRGRMSPAEIARLAGVASLEVESDTGGRDWAAKSLRGKPSPILIEERIVALRKHGP